MWDKLPNLSILTPDIDLSKATDYVVKSSGPDSVTADDDRIAAKVWFQSPPLSSNMINRISRAELYTESSDQGWVSADTRKEAGNWTWFELCILEDEDSTTPKTIGGVELVWRSHYNPFGKAEDDNPSEKGSGEVQFDQNHEIFTLLEEGNVLAVRISARFAEWEINAEEGYLVISISSTEVERNDPPPSYEVADEIKTIYGTLSKANRLLSPGYYPSIPSYLFRADVFQIDRDARPLRVLSLDGGGVRGLSALYLLKAVMDHIEPPKKPWQVFDMIAGTSTGGLIAIMLGRLEMTADECIHEYRALMEKVFNKHWYKNGAVTSSETYDSSFFETAIKELIVRRGMDKDVQLFGEPKSPQNRCKVFVVAVQKLRANNTGPVLLRSYKRKVSENDPVSFPNIKLWEAARATSAAPTYFKPLTMERECLVDGKPQTVQEALIDGGLGANNPLGWLWTEVLDSFGPSRPADCFLSIGTGIPSNQEVEVSIAHLPTAVEAMSGVATNSELTNILFRTLIDAYAPKTLTRKYWRLNVSEKLPAWVEVSSAWKVWKKGEILHPEGFESPGKLDDLEALKGFITLTERHIEVQEDTIQACADALSKKF